VGGVALGGVALERISARRSLATTEHRTDSTARHEKSRALPNQPGFAVAE